MTQNVKFDDRTWARLATMAHEQDTTIADLIERAALRLLVGTIAETTGRGSELEKSRDAHRAAVARRIIALREQGLTITKIAAATSYSRSYVSRILCDNGARTYSKTTQNKEQAA